LLSINDLEVLLNNNHCDYRLLSHDTPIISTQDAAKYFDINKAAPTFIIDTEKGLISLIISSKQGRIDFKAIKNEFGFSKFRMADKEKVMELTGYQVGTIPLVGHNLPTIFDDWLLEHDYIYGGTGSELHTLMIAPSDIIRINNVVQHINKNRNK